jgi:hypothetical protein
MSNFFAIAGVTRTLLNLLTPIASASFATLPSEARPTAEILVSALSLDKIPEDPGKNRVNLFLYQAEHNPAWRNLDPPVQTRPGEAAHPSLALNLNYLLTARGQDGSELIGHLLLGMAMNILHDHAVLSRQELETALAASGLHEQIERLRVTPHLLSLEEISKLWTGFQSEYRLSAAYQVAVVLIDSQLPARTPLPVLRRGADDRGPYVFTAPFPALLAVNLPRSKASAELGDTLTLSGSQLDGGHATVRLRHPLLAPAMSLSPLAGDTGTEMQVRLPDIADDPQVPSQMAAGFYRLALVVAKPGFPSWTTNEVAFALAPRVTDVSPQTIAAANLPAALTLKCVPQIRPEQKVGLLFQDREISAESVTTPADPTAESTAVFTLREADPGDYVVRLRVDGVDSIPVIFSDTGPPGFNPAHQVKITP